MSCPQALAEVSMESGIARCETLLTCCCCAVDLVKAVPANCAVHISPVMAIGAWVALSIGGTKGEIRKLAKTIHSISCGVNSIAMSVFP